MNQKGFSLTELLVSQVGLGFLLVLIAGLWVLATSVIQDANHSAAILEATFEMRRSLSAPGECTRNLVGLDLSPNVSSGVAVPSLSVRNPASGSTETLAETGTSHLGVTASQIRLKPSGKVGLVMVAANLELTFSTPGGRSRSTAPRTISLLAQVQQGKVKECWVRKEGSNVAADETCKTLTKGALDYFNPATGRCELANGQWFEGADNSRATCPEGTMLPPHADEDYNCESAPPAGFQDPSAPISVTMSDGSVQEARKDPYMYWLDPHTKSCKCAYATDLPASQIAAFKCRIQCVVL